MNSLVFRLTVICLVLGLVFTAPHVQQPREPLCSRYGDGPCEFENKPVCGTDGYTYGNECELCRENGERAEKIQIQDDGTCPPPPPHRIEH